MRRDRRKSDAGKPENRQRRTRFYRFHFERLEGRMLLSGGSLLGGLLSAPTALISSVAAAAGLTQSTSTPAAQTDASSSGNSPLLSLGSQNSTGPSNTNSVGPISIASPSTGSGLSLNLGGLLGLHLGGTSEADNRGSDSGGQSTSGDPADGNDQSGQNQAGQSASGQSLLSLTLGGVINLGVGQPIGLQPSGNGSGNGENTGAASSVPTGAPGGLTAVVSTDLRDLLREMFDIDGEQQPDSPPPDGAGQVSGAQPGSDSDGGHPTIAVDVLAQSVSQSKGTKPDDPHTTPDATTASVTVANPETSLAAQAASPAALLNTVPLPTNETLTTPTVTNPTEEGLPLMGRIAAAVLPTAMQLTANGAIEEVLNARSGVTADDNLPADESAPQQPTAATLPAVVGMVPSELLAVVPGDLRAVDQALEKLLDEIDAIGGGLIDYAAGSGALQWVTAGAGMAACVGGAYLRRKGRGSDEQSLEEESANWMFSRMQGLAAGDET